MKQQEKKINPGKFKLSYNLLKLVLASIFTFSSLSTVNAQGGGLATAYPQCLPGFTDEIVSNGWADLRQITFDSLGRMYVVEAQGKVFIIDTNGVKQIVPLIDISQEVGWWNAHGLLGIALDKDFLSNGYIYLMYTVDRHYLMNYGTASYNASINEYNNATITRVTRYKADASTNYTSIIAGSRFILLGSDKKNGIPCIYNNHDGGGIEMSLDGSILISTGDGGHGGAIDTGSNSQTYYVQALIDTILTPEANVGAYRSLQKESLNGKMLRIDPITGLGLPSNPYYDAANPASTQSKIWSMGLRNPFRFSIRPNTSAINNTALGQPGSLFISQVGFHTWEDLYVADGAGKNFGWPIYEGMFPHSFFAVQTIENKFAPNPQYGINGCTNQYFKFTDLLINATLSPSPSWPNPCDSLMQIPSDFKQMRSRPTLSYNHTSAISYVPGYIGNDPTETIVGSAGSPASGTPVYGVCTAGSAWYSGSAYPSQFNNKMFFIDFGKGFMASANVDINNNISAVDTFASSLADPISICYDKKDQCMYYIEYPYEIHRIRYTYGLNVAPKAIAKQDKYYGPGPLTVNFNGLSSSDPENAPLTYFWDFGDGNTSTLSTPQHTYNPATSNPTEYFVILTVVDTGGLTGTTQLIVSANNTPPVVQITSPINGTYYSEIFSQIWNLTASVSDAEHDSTQLHYSWYTALHHNFHTHPNPIDTNKTTYLVTDPEDCLDSYYYEITLTVSDDAGLSTSQTVEIYQQCPISANFISDVTNVCRGDSVHFFSNVIGHADSVKWTFQLGTPSTSNAFNPVIAYKSGFGLKDVTLIAYNVFGSDTLIANDYINIKVNAIVNQNITGTIISCVDDSILLSTNDTSVNRYQWKKNGVSLLYDTLNTYLAKTTGNYNVVVTLIGNGCSKSSVPLNYIEHNISESLTLSGSSILCTTDSVVMIADFDSSYSYQWFLNGNLINGANNNSYIAWNTGNYYATVNDTNTCSAITNIVTVIKTPDAAIIFTSDSIICPAGDVVTMDANTGIGLSYQWFMNGSIINGAISASYTATIEALYTVLVSDVSGCSHYSNDLNVASCVGVSNYSNADIINIYPNPVANNIHIGFKSTDNAPIKIKVLDALGKVLLGGIYENRAGNNEITLKTSTLSPGVYQIVIESETFIGTRRFIKN